MRSSKFPSNLLYYIFGMLSGLSIGWMLCAGHLKQPPQRADAQTILRNLSRELDLQENQKAELNPIIEDLVAEMDRQFLVTSKAVILILEQHHERMKAHLSAPQKSKMDEINRERIAAIEKHIFQKE